MPEIAPNSSDIEHECMRLAAAGLTRAQISYRLGISLSEVRRILKQHGFEAAASDLPTFISSPSDDYRGKGRSIAKSKGAASQKMSQRLRKIALEYRARAESEKLPGTQKEHGLPNSKARGLGISVLRVSLEALEIANRAPLVYSDDEIYTQKDGVYISEDVRNSEYAEKLRVLDEFAATHPGQPISALVAELFPNPHVEIDADGNERVPLPTVAPALWSEEKSRRESPPDFIKRVYAPWIGNGLVRQHIRHLDRKLYQALATWIRRNGQLDFDLPKSVEVTDRWIDRVRAGEEKPASIREYSRLSSALQRRQIRGSFRD